MENIVRPPIVVVVGHVDHGKTSLLDAIRKTSVTKKEAGGITQSIGASVAVTKENKKITFIDTPGHALFSKMRSRGVTIADIAVLVVAADDGVKPQTKEAIQILKESQIPFVVAITKIDLPTANTDMVLQSLEKEGVFFEKRGGEVSYVGVSSKEGIGIENLLDLITLISEVHGIKGNSKENLEGFVIETSKDKRGLLVSVVVKSGQIKKGDFIYANDKKAKVKGIFGEDQRPIDNVVAGFPAQILGFEELPLVGAKITSNPTSIASQMKSTNAVDSKAKIKIFVKAKTAGSLEALLANIPAGVQVIGSGIGDVTENDIFISKAANAFIFLFESKFSSQIKRLAETEGVKIQKFEIVYEFIEKLQKMIEEGKEQISGVAQILASFPFDHKKVAGCKIEKGTIKKTDLVKLFKGEKEIGKVKIVSIKKQREEVNEVSQGEECGILFEPNLDFAIGDMLISQAKA